MAGSIEYSEQWALTPEIESILQNLAALNVDIFSGIGSGTEYTLMIPHTVHKNDFAAIEQLIRQLEIATDGVAIFADAYPHGMKYRVYSAEEAKKFRLRRGPL